MIEQVRDYVQGLFRDAKIEAFLGLKNANGSVVPHLYEKPEELDATFSLGDLEGPGDARYPIGSILAGILRADTNRVFGVLVRGCDDRAVNELVRWNQITAWDRIVRVGIACPAELAQSHECRKPFPDECVAGQKADAVANASVSDIMALSAPERLEYWKAVFDRCIKCYGCRDICPVCFCKVCSLEEDVLIKTGDLPPENPMFHLTRAAHMAGRCIDCNLCTEVCPAEIPLRTLYKKVAEIVRTEFHHITGEAGGSKCPLNFLGPDPGHTSAND